MYNFLWEKNVPTDPSRHRTVKQRNFPRRKKVIRTQPSKNTR